MAAREAGRAGWDSETLTAPLRCAHTRSHTHTKCWFSASFCIRSPNSILFGLTAKDYADILSCVHILCILSLSVSLPSFETWQAATSHWRRLVLLFQVTPLFSFLLRSEKKKHWAAFALWSSQGSFPGYKLTWSSQTNALSKTIQCLSGPSCHSL